MGMDRWVGGTQRRAARAKQWRRAQEVHDYPNAVHTEEGEEIIKALKRAELEAYQ